MESLRKELRADRWNFVQLPWGVLKEELRGVTEVLSPCMLLNFLCQRGCFG